MSTTQSARFFRPSQYAECIIGPKSVLPFTSRLGGSVVMGPCAVVEARSRAKRWLCAAFLGVAAIFSLPFDARAQDTAIMTRGDAAVTAFSGARQIGNVPADLHPLDLTFIDVNGATLQVFDLTELGAAADGLVDYFRCISGEHPDWEEYREAMRIQNKSLIRITPTRWVRSLLVDSRPTWPPDSTADQTRWAAV